MKIVLGLAIFLAMLAMFALLVEIIVGLGIWVFRPLDNAAKGRRCPTQFTVVDFLCLFFIVQAPTALIHSKTFADGAGVYWLDGFVWICCGLIWWKSVEVMSRAGIRRPWHRIVFLTVVFPVTVVASIATPILPFAFFASLDGPSIVALIVVGVGFAAAGGLMFSAWFTRRMVAAAAPAQAREPDAGEVGEVTLAGAEDAGRQTGDPLPE
ncbi:MAG: hypothetical protein NTW96_21800 [Planctomycetia bacterium]|nr:hypothetical protein [Planctomycetia bacterium]